MKRKYYSVVPAGSGKLLFSHWAAGSGYNRNLKNLSCLIALACRSGKRDSPLTSSASAIPLDVISGVPRLIICSPLIQTVPSSAFTDTSVFVVLPFLLCVLYRCRLTKSSFTEPYYMGCGMPKGIRSCAPQIFALHQFSKHHRVGSHLFKNVKELIAFSNSQQTRWRSTSLSISSFLRRTVRSN